MSDGLSDYWAARLQGRVFDTLGGSVRMAFSDTPIVPRRVTEYGRVMYEGDLGLPINTTPAYFWLGRDAEAA